MFIYRAMVQAARPESIDIYKYIVSLLTRLIVRYVDLQYLHVYIVTLSMKGVLTLPMIYCHVLCRKVNWPIFLKLQQPQMHSL